MFSCLGNNVAKHFMIIIILQEMVLQDLKPFTWYTVSILAYNENGDGPQAELAVQTLEGCKLLHSQCHVPREIYSLFLFL